MGKIYTGYFAQLKKYEDAGLTPISISRWSPKWYKGEECNILAPSSDLLTRYKNGQADDKQYIREYVTGLFTIDLKRLMEDLSKDRDIVLLCYEKNEDFCHRHLLSEFLRKKYGMTVNEFDYTRKCNANEQDNPVIRM